MGGVGDPSVACGNNRRDCRAHARVVVPPRGREIIDQDYRAARGRVLARTPTASAPSVKWAVEGSPLHPRGMGKARSGKSTAASSLSAPLIGVAPSSGRAAHPDLARPNCAGTVRRHAHRRETPPSVAAVADASSPRCLQAGPRRSSRRHCWRLQARGRSSRSIFSAVRS